MSNNMNRRFAEVMTALEENDQDTYRAIKSKVESLKAESATWRRRAQGVTDHGETPKKSFDGEVVPQ